MRPEIWEHIGKYREIDGLEVFSIGEPDSDEPLLCLHGFPTSSFDYKKVWEAFAREFDPFSYDMIGYGFSAKPVDFDYKTFSQVDVLQSLLAELNVSRLHILSHDYGNTIVQELLARGSEGRLDFEILSICFMNGALFPETHRPILAQKILIGPIGPLFGRLIPASGFKRSLSSVFGEDTRPSDEEMRDFIRIFEHNRGRRISHKLIQYMREREKYRERWLTALERMRQPFRFINGLADPVSGSHLVKRFRELLPAQTDIVELEGVGHFPHFECPDIVIDRYSEFRKKIF